MTKDEIAMLAEKICIGRPTALQVRLMLEDALRKDERGRGATYTEQRVIELERQLSEAHMTIAGYVEEAAKGAGSCEHCRLIVARYEVPRG